MLGHAKLLQYPGKCRLVFLAEPRLCNHDGSKFFFWPEHREGFRKLRAGKLNAAGCRIRNALALRIVEEIRIPVMPHYQQSAFRWDDAMHRFGPCLGKLLMTWQ